MKPMSVRRAREVLRKHNAWRRGRADDMQDPKDIGQAIDALLEATAPKRKVQP